ncbi:hypothetical protein DsansV1_C29g0207561 [Dioscorea sansibarensis]
MLNIDLFIQACNVRLIKRQVSSQKDKKDHPTRPYISSCTVITSIIEDTSGAT